MTQLPSGQDHSARGWSSVDRHVCPVCVMDLRLADALREAAIVDVCDYCGASTPGAPLAAPVDVLLDVVVPGLRRAFVELTDRPRGEPPCEDWQPLLTLRTEQLLLECDVTDDDKLLADLAGAIDTVWWRPREA